MSVVPKFKGFAVQGFNNGSMAAPFKDFGCASAFNNGSMLSATPQRSKVQQWFKGTTCRSKVQLVNC